MRKLEVIPENQWTEEMIQFNETIKNIDYTAEPPEINDNTILYHVHQGPYRWYVIYFRL